MDMAAVAVLPLTVLYTVASYFLSLGFLGVRPLVCEQSYTRQFSDISQDISDNVVRQGAHYIAIGEHSDLWEGIMSDKKVGCRHQSFLSNLICNRNPL